MKVGKTYFTGVLKVEWVFLNSPLELKFREHLYTYGFEGSAPT